MTVFALCLSQGIEFEYPYGNKDATGFVRYMVNTFNDRFVTELEKYLTPEETLSLKGGFSPDTKVDYDLSELTSE